MAQTSPGSQGQRRSSDPHMQTRPLATLPGPGSLHGGGRGGPRTGEKRAVLLSRQPLERLQEEPAGRTGPAGRSPACQAPHVTARGAGVAGADRRLQGATKAGHHAPQTFDGLMPTSPGPEGQQTRVSGRPAVPCSGGWRGAPRTRATAPLPAWLGWRSRSPQSRRAPQRPFSPGAPRRGRMGRPFPRGPAAPLLAGPATPLHARSSGHGTERLAEAPRAHGPSRRDVNLTPAGRSEAQAQQGGSSPSRWPGCP